jgi:hypothetical protein
MADDNRARLIAQYRENLKIPAPASTAAATNKAPPKANNAPKPTSTTQVGTGLIAALNNYQQQQVKLGKYNVADIYEIQFADEILASATVTPPGGLNKGLTGSAVGATAADQKLPEKQNMDASTRIRSATAGQQIVQFIDQVLRASSYILDQSAVIWNEKTQTWELNGKPASQFAWFNVQCNAEKLTYDDKRNDHAYRMTFVITPYQIPVQSEYFKPGEFRGAHKVYNYWFTGQNTQVLQYEQHFNKLWTQAITGTKLPETIRQQVNPQEQWKRHVFPNSNQSSQGAEQNTFEPGANAADYLYSADQADIKLSVLGDPAWIPNPTLGYITPVTFTAAPFYPDGTINISASGAFITFAWNRPVDYDLQTGLMDPGKNNYFAKREAGAAGLATEAVNYVINEVVSSFKGGKFTQELHGKWLADPKVTTNNANVGRPTPAVKDDQSRDSNQSAAETNRLLNANNRAPAPRADGITNLANTSLQAAKNEVASGRITAAEAKNLLTPVNGVAISERDLQAFGGRAYLQSIIDGTTNATGTPKPPQPFAKEF